ncbi:hypothetical protein SPRG_06925 [Saprolegnia parasitica CBS 223.65]|uniref:Uncharacterized protein n=1 Tax=Saprolegnia parasitica (strain CBS 223.65) TaxID=695850 RepID=A0A067CA71_SAPPC|nr:hypothetical protein SPRG_06925 [Saprolegnia parasitica CBS 223.65]KDO27654.1 hypothetical protein SPRG_06925 [Saprolegnia parasitica CBS 223.65]|eukprot:XP_012201775.1 hypothetical protein SPRG_06925 [Saprolegnia parasitica CBS 223.65]
MTKPAKITRGVRGVPFTTYACKLVKVSARPPGVIERLQLQWRCGVHLADDAKRDQLRDQR